MIMRSIISSKKSFSSSLTALKSVNQILHPDAKSLGDFQTEPCEIHFSARRCLLNLWKRNFLFRRDSCFRLRSQLSNENGNDNKSTLGGAFCNSVFIPTHYYRVRGRRLKCGRGSEKLSEFIRAGESLVFPGVRVSMRTEVQCRVRVWRVCCLYAGRVCSSNPMRRQFQVGFRSSDNSFFLTTRKKSAMSQQPLAFLAGLWLRLTIE